MTNSEKDGSSLPRALTAFAFLMALWLLWSGHYTGLLISFGALSCAGVVLLSWRMGILDREALPVDLLPRTLAYLPWLLAEIFKANVDVVRRILGPRSALTPEIFEVEPSQSSDLGRVIYANSITLTPGTITIEAEGRTITVHAISREAADGIRTGDMDHRVTNLEGGS